MKSTKSVVYVLSILIVNWFGFGSGFLGLIFKVSNNVRIALSQPQQIVSRRLPPLRAEMRILIQGTKNAYTTVMNNDVVLFTLEKSVNKKQTKALGVFTSTDQAITPLCNYEEGSASFYRDVTQTGLSATELEKNGQILRILSSDRLGDRFTIDEFLDSDIYIPVQRDPTLPTVIPTIQCAVDASIVNVQCVNDMSMLDCVNKVERSVAVIEQELLNLKQFIQHMKAIPTRE